MRKMQTDSFFISDANDSQSLLNTIKWKSAADEVAKLKNGNCIPCILIDNIIDLLGKDISQQKLLEFSKENHFDNAYQVSVKKRINIDESMNFLLKQILYQMNNYSTKILEKDIAKKDCEFEALKKKNRTYRYKNELKILIIGSDQSGVTSFINRFSKNYFLHTPVPDHDVEIKTLPIDGEQGRVHLWDISKQSSTMVDIVSKGAHGLVAISDATFAQGLKDSIISTDSS